MRLHNREICGNRLNRAPSIPVGVRPSWFRWIVFVDDLDPGEEDVEVELVLFCRLTWGLTLIPTASPTV